MYRTDASHAKVWESVKCSGLTPGAEDIALLAEQLPKKWAVSSYKRACDIIWVVFIGGTGTGKSTIFNALCNKPLSETGVERPKTFGPIVYAHKSRSSDKSFPLASMKIKHASPEDLHSAPHTGAPGQLVILRHSRQDLSHLALVDTPDLDSLEIKNRQMMEDLYLLSDIVIFVTSQEKYADDVPFQFLERIHKEGKPYFLLLNKSDIVLTQEDVLTSLARQNLVVPKDRFWMLPYLPSHPSEWLPEDLRFRGFADVFSQEVSNEAAGALLDKERQRSARELAVQMQQLIDLLEEENRAAEKWLEHLDLFFKSASRKLFDEQEKDVTEESREYIQNEIRKHFSKYDLLGKPRRLVSQIVLTPLRVLGLSAGRSQETHAEALERIRNKIDLAPIQAAVDSLNRSVLEKLSPRDESSPLYKKIRNPDVILSRAVIKERVWEEQDKLVYWLERTFQELARGIPRSKEWGIYSTSILWGGLIISLEAAIGGGISILEAVLDSAVAPFVTKGAVELFAYQELQKIARELTRRYKEGVLSVIREQRDRYIECLRSTMIAKATLDELRSLQSEAMKR